MFEKFLWSDKFLFSGALDLKGKHIESLPLTGEGDREAVERAVFA